MTKDAEVDFLIVLVENNRDSFCNGTRSYEDYIRIKKEVRERLLALFPETLTEEECFNSQSIDARVWAKEFMRIYQSQGEKWVDEELMIGWFANAIMAGYDEAHRRCEKSLANRIPKGEKPSPEIEPIPEYLISGETLDNLSLRKKINELVEAVNRMKEVSP